MLLPLPLVRLFRGFRRGKHALLWFVFCFPCTLAFVMGEQVKSFFFPCFFFVLIYFVLEKCCRYFLFFILFIFVVVAGVAFVVWTTDFLCVIDF